LQPDCLIVGLGNPGKKYERTRHNIGFMTCDYIASFFGIPFHFGPGNSKILQWRFNEKTAIVAKPQTFMNMSGEAVAKLMLEYNLIPEQLLVIYDDVALPLGTMRVRRTGNAGGHKGFRSIISCLQTKSIPRLRIGVGGATPIEDVVTFVLANFRAKELKMIQRLIPAAVECIQFWMIEGINRTMMKFNRHFDFSCEQNQGG